jgi:hypothetical protein
MLARERPDFRTVDRWAVRILLEAGAIHKCDQHGWAKDRADPHAREEALRLARDEPLPGLSSEEAVAAVRGVLGAAGGSGPKTMTRDAFDALSPLERAAKNEGRFHAYGSAGDEAREQKARCQTNAALRL